MAYTQLSDRIRAILTACRPGENPVNAALDLIEKIFEPYQTRADMTSRYEHSLRTGIRGREIADGEGWTWEPLVIACLLHDTGYAECTEQADFRIHQEISAEIAEIFLANIGYDPEQSRQIRCAVFLHNLWDRLPDDAAPFELSVRDADDLDRFDALRIYKKGASMMGDSCAAEIADMCRSQLDEIESHRSRPCATPTAQKLWNDQLAFRERYFRDLLDEMDKTAGCMRYFTEKNEV